MAFKMKGKSMTKGTKAHTDAIKLNRSMDATNRPDGRAGSSAFQFSQPGAGGPGGDDPKTAAAKAQGREVGEMNKSSKFHPDNVGRKRGAESGFKKKADVEVTQDPSSVGSIKVSKTNRPLGKDKTTTYSPIGGWEGKVFKETTKRGKNKNKEKGKVISEKKAGRQIKRAAKLHKENQPTNIPKDKIFKAAGDTSKKGDRKRKKATKKLNKAGISPA